MYFSLFVPLNTTKFLKFPFWFICSVFEYVSLCSSSDPPHGCFLTVFFFLVLDILIAFLICALMGFFCVYPIWVFLRFLNLWILVCFICSTSFTSSSLISFILMLDFSLFHVSFMLFPIFSSFSPPCVLQYFLLPHLLVHQCCILFLLIYSKTLLLNSQFHLLYFSIVKFMFDLWIPVIWWNLPSFHFTFPSVLSYFVECVNHNYSSVFIWELQCLDHLWFVVILLFYLVLSLDKPYFLIECILFYIKNCLRIMLCFFRIFLSFLFNFFLGRESVVLLSQFSQRLSRFKAGLIMLCLLFAPLLGHGSSQLPAEYPGLFTGDFGLDLQPPVTGKWLERKVAAVC